MLTALTKASAMLVMSGRMNVAAEVTAHRTRNMSGSNGRTFRNMCDFKQTICEERGNYTNYHPGRCNGIKYCLLVY